MSCHIWPAKSRLSGHCRERSRREGSSTSRSLCTNCSAAATWRTTELGDSTRRLLGTRFKTLIRGKPSKRHPSGVTELCTGEAPLPNSKPRSQQTPRPHWSRILKGSTPTIARRGRSTCSQTCPEGCTAIGDHRECQEWSESCSCKWLRCSRNQTGMMSCPKCPNPRAEAANIETRIVLSPPRAEEMLPSERLVGRAPDSRSQFCSALAVLRGLQVLGLVWSLGIEGAPEGLKCRGTGPTRTESPALLGRTG